MKKALIIFLTLVIGICMSVNAYASSFDFDEQYTHTTDVSAYAYSTFTYEIPAALEVDGHNVNPFSVTITEFNLDYNSVILVSVSNIQSGSYVTLNHSLKPEVTTNLYLYANEGLSEKFYPGITMRAFRPAELEAGDNMFTFYTVMEHGAIAGEYTGTLQFNLTLGREYDMESE